MGALETPALPEPPRKPFHRTCLALRSWSWSFSAQLPTPPTLEPPGPCPKGQFTCDQGKRCLHLQMLCNFKAECDDASDEQQCGKGPRQPESGMRSSPFTSR